MTEKRKTLTSITAVTLVLLLLLVPLAQRKGSIRAFYYDNWAQQQFRGILNQFRYALGDTVFDNGLIVDRTWAVYTLEQSLEDYQRIEPLSDADLQTIQQKLDRETAALAAKGVKTLVVIPPNKNTIYPERVPAFVSVQSGPSNLDRFLSYMSAHGQTPVLDLRPALLSEKLRSQVYYATDTHWTPSGAYAGYSAVVARLAQWFPAIHTVPSGAMLVQPTGQASGNIFRGLGITAAVEPLFEVQPGPGLAGERVSWGNHHWYTQDPQGAVRAAVYHDSFGDALIPLFQDTFAEAHYYLDRYYNISPEWIDKWEPDVVIIEFTELYLKNFLDDRALGTDQVP